jgi:ankyrin repeat protein
VETLIKCGAKLDAVDEQGETALMKAAYRGNSTVARLLAKNGADCDSVSKGYRTAMGIAKDRGHLDVISALKKYSKQVFLGLQRQMGLCETLTEVAQVPYEITTA